MILKRGTKGSPSGENATSYLQKLQRYRGGAITLDLPSDISLENFALVELRKQATWSKTQPQFFHFRTRKWQELDIVLKNAVSEIVGIEVKASSTVKSSDFKGLKYLSDLLGNRSLRGVVLYTDDQSVPFGSNLYALPVSTLWRSGEAPHGKSGDKI